jgi:hypothetical protein
VQFSLAREFSSKHLKWDLNNEIILPVYLIVKLFFRAPPACLNLSVLAQLRGKQRKSPLMQSISYPLVEVKKLHPNSSSILTGVVV